MAALQHISRFSRHLALSLLMVGGSMSPVWANLDSHLAPYSKQEKALTVVNIKPHKWQAAISKASKDNPELAEVLAELNHELKENLGLDFAQDILRNLGQHFSMVYQMNDQALTLLFNLDLRSGSKMETLLKNWHQKQLNSEQETEFSSELKHFGPQAYYLMAFNESEAFERAAFAVVGNQLIGSIGTSDNAQNALKRMLYTQAVISKDSHWKLSNQDLFKPIKEHLHDHDIWGYADLKALLPLVEILGLSDGFNLDSKKLDAAWLQDYLHYYRGLGLGLNIDDQGLGFSFYAGHDLKNLTPYQQKFLTSHLPGYGSEPDAQAQQLLNKIPENAIFLASGEHLDQALTHPIPTDADLPEEASDLRFTPKQLNTFANAFNLDFETELLPAMDGRAAIALFNGNAQQPIPQFALLMGLNKDKALAFEQTLAEKLKFDLNSLFGKMANAADYAKTASMKANMHTLQTIVETYGVDYGGVYPENLEQLKLAATDESMYPTYWKPVRNPVSNQSGLGESIMDYADFQAEQAQIGTVYYEGRNPIKDKDGKTSFESYVIYGYGLDGKLYGLSYDTELENIEPESSMAVLRNDLAQFEKAPPEIQKPDFLEDFEGSKIYRLPISEELAKEIDLGTSMQRANISSLKANMHTLQTIVETYGVDWGGYYPESIENLKTHAEDSSQATSPYWKDFKNPETNQTGLKQSVDNYSGLKRDGAQVGQVFYEPRNPQKDAEGETVYTAYVIYAYGADGQLYAMTEDESLIQPLDLNAYPPIVETNLPVPESTEENEAFFEPVFARQDNLLIVAQTPTILKEILAKKPGNPSGLKYWQTQKHSQDANVHYFLNLKQIHKQFKDLDSDSEFLELISIIKGSKGLYGYSREEPKGSFGQIFLNLEMNKIPWAQIFRGMPGNNYTEQGRVSLVKANMHTLQIIVETYGVDYGGIYASDLNALEAAAKDTTQGASSYWKELTNPYSGETGPAATLMEYKNYSPDPQYQGMTLYEVTGENPTRYKIYGTDKNGELITDEEQVFILSNS